MRPGLSHILFLAVALAVTAPGAYAQFREEKVQDYGTDKQDTTKIFSIKEYFAGLSHKQEITLGSATIGSTFIIGGMQIYERKTWKLPVIYGGLATTLGCGIGFNVAYKNTLGEGGSGGNRKFKDISTGMFIGAGAIYWATLMDGAICYKSDIKPLPARSTVFSLLCPGLGQIYNGEAWKVPIYVGAIGTGVYFTTYFNRQYVRYHDRYIESQDSNSKYYRDNYRRYRDYAILVTAAVYVLQIIDANVFAFMQDFDVNDDISLNVSPTVIVPDTQFALHPSTGLGLRMGLTF